jgi:hypothetical protein
MKKGDVVRLISRLGDDINRLISQLSKGKRIAEQCSYDYD